MSQNRCFPAALALALMACAAHAAPRPSPQDPQAKTPPVLYRSALADYRPYAEAKPDHWVATNKAVTPAPAASVPAHKH